MTNKEFSKLSWTLLEHRVRYYLMDAPIIDDLEFDAFDRRYLQACKELKQPNTLSSQSLDGVSGAGMVGVDITRPCVQSVIYKLRGGHYE